MRETTGREPADPSISWRALGPTRASASASAPGAATTPWRAGRRAEPRAVGSLVPTITAKAFERYGFATATLLTEWAAIVGGELARYTAPERLKWPREYRLSDGDDDGPGRQGAILFLRVDAGRAIEVQYRAAQIIERINVHFGYRAVSELRIFQAPVEGALEAAAPRGERPPHRDRPARSSPSPIGPETSADILAEVEDCGLRAALQRMHDGMRQRASISACPVAN